MQPMQVLQCVRRGLAVTSSARIEVMRGCVDLDVVDENWVPRWALQAAISLEKQGYGPQQVSALFAQGRGRVMAELLGLAKAGKLARPVEPRHAYERTEVDQATALALTTALVDHRALCGLCREEQQCLDRDLLQEELNALFPEDRRRQRRS
jgi:hypothetical protein